MREHRLADAARPHPEAAAELARFGVAGEVLPQAALVDVVLPADGARVVGGPSLR